MPINIYRVKNSGENTFQVKVMDKNISIGSMCSFSWSIMLIKSSINIHIYN